MNVAIFLCQTENAPSTLCGKLERKCLFSSKLLNSYTSSQRIVYGGWLFFFFFFFFLHPIAKQEPNVIWIATRAIWHKKKKKNVDHPLTLSEIPAEVTLQLCKNGKFHMHVTAQPGSSPAHILRAGPGNMAVKRPLGKTWNLIGHHHIQEDQSDLLLPT